MVLLDSVGRRPVSIRDSFLIVATLTTIATFSPALLKLLHRWNGQAEYSHGFLIPLVSLWLLWARRDALRASAGQPNWLGPALILLAVAMYIAGQLSASITLSGLGFVFALAGVVLGAGGRSLLQLTFVPLAYLLFAIPLPGFLESSLTLRLQLISSQLGTFFISLFGIPVFADGNIIDLGNYKLLIAEACSGLRYVFPLLSLSFLAAYMFRAPIWQRALIFLSSIPIAVALNGLRIGLVGFSVDRWGPEAAEGALHFFEGWTIFVACSLVLLTEMYLLAIFSGKSFSDLCCLPKIRVDARSRHKDDLIATRPLLACLALLIVGGLAAFTSSNRSGLLEPRNSFAEFPVKVGDWRGHASSLDAQTVQILDADDYLLADYGTPDGATVNLFVAYYGKMAGKATHSPVNCIPAGGWQILEERQIRLAQPVNRVIIQKDGKRLLVYYWFDEQGQYVASDLWAKFYRLVNSVARQRSDSALIRFVTEIGIDESEGKADQRLQSFMQVALPQLATFLPGVAVESRPL